MDIAVYQSSLPRLIPEKMVQSFCITALISAAAGSVLPIAAAAGAVAALATLVEACVRPVIIHSFQGHDTMSKWIPLGIKIATAVSTCSALGISCSVGVVSLLFWFTLNFPDWKDPVDENRAMAMVFGSV